MNQRSPASITARIKREFPDHRIDTAFPICLPVYELRLKVTVLVEHKLSTAARFVLRLIDLDVSTTSDICLYLGLSETQVLNVAADLIGSGLIVQRTDLGIGTTEHGRLVLSQNGRSMRPQNRHPRVPYDPLTKRIVDIEIDSLIDKTTVRKHGLYVTPTRPRRPTLNQVGLEGVQRYCNAYPQRKDDSEILDISAIKDVKLKYRQDILLFKLLRAGSTKPAFAAYSAQQQYLEDESAALQRLADAGVDLVPDEFRSATLSMPAMNAMSVSKEELELLTTIDEINREVDDVDAELEKARTNCETAHDERERKAFESTVREKESRNTDKRYEAATHEDELSKKTRGQIRLIKTEEHRELLLRAIREATSELTLVSAWIKPKAFDTEVCMMLAEAIHRGVTVRIGWGLGTTRRGGERERNSAGGRAALAQLEKVVPQKECHRLVVRRTETHEKYIICDDLFCAWGSFNWLSYRGELDEGYRRESSFYTERAEDIAMWKANTVTLFGKL